MSRYACCLLLAYFVLPTLGLMRTEAGEVVSVNCGGATLRGELLKVTKTEVTLKVQGREQSVPVNMMDPKDYYACGKIVLDPKDAKGHFELGEWCKQKGLEQAAQELFGLAVALDKSTYAEKVAAQSAKKGEMPKAGVVSGPEALIVQLGHADQELRDKASQQLTKLGEKAVAALEKAAQESEDLEVRTRSNRILAELQLKKELAKLSPEEQEIAQLPFEINEKEETQSLTLQVRGHGACAVVDIGRVRLVFKNQPFGGSTRATVSFVGGGTTTVSAGSFTMTSSGGVAHCVFRNFKFSITYSEVVLGEKQIPTQEGRRVVLLSKDGALEKQVALDLAKAK